MPSLHANHSSPRSSPWRCHLPVSATVFTGVLLTGLLFLGIRAWERREAEAVLHARAAQRLELLREALGNSLEALHSLGAFYNTRGSVSRSEFRQFVGHTLARHPELQALSWTPRVPASERAAVEASVRAEGFPDFKFTERDPLTQHTAPARERTDFYYPVYYIEPLARNLTAFGYDLNSRLPALTLARDEARAISTPPLRLIQEEHNQPGFIVYLPLFAGPAPASTAARLAANTGFVAAVFRIDDLARPALGQQPGLRVTLGDTAINETVIYTAPAADDAPLSDHLAPCTLTLPFAGREWIVTFTPTVNFDAGVRPWQSWAVLAGGLALTGLLAGYLLAGRRRAAEIALANATLQTEVAERKRAEEAAAAANRAKSDFLASLSHEIRTPLNSILGYTQILERDPDFPVRQRDAVGALANSGRHLLGLLNSILDLSKIEAGRMEVERGVFDLIALTEGIVEMFKPRCAEKHLSLRASLPSGGPRPVVGDEGKLRQILINLIGNAVKFTPRGEIIVGLSPLNNEQWRFEVIDTGIGLEPAERAGLFAPFHQTLAGRRLGGTGLGLAIARRHVELLGGRIEVQSEPNIGTRFHFALTLPAAVLHPSFADRPLPHLAAGVRVRALVVDDNRDNRFILARLLSDLGCITASAATTSAARDIVAQEAPDILFIDVLLGETTGPALLAALRADGLPATVPAVYHTAALLGPADREALQSDGGGLLVKPFRAEDLCTCLQRIPGVRFDDAPPDAGPLPLDLDDIVLPEDLCTRMSVAAELHSTTVLKACLEELRQLGGPAVPLADHLRQLLRAYDLTAIARLLNRLRVQSPVST
ncbi:MAG: CHASE domain-containing protein [Opitutaceae bacterium]|nr:CHASE domain-containing protein [Opitutaceae bacterium]